MKNNLLFVNHNREIIREFLEAMREYPIEIDTADHAAEIAAVLKKKKYKLVITGMNMPGFDGSKLIACLNQYFPKTVCMVYTRRLELAHLKLLVNERRVFRIFQKPADFAGEVYNAVVEAFEYYDMQESKHQEKQILEQKLRSVRENLKELEQAAVSREEEKQEIAVFLQTLLKTYAKNIKIALNREERHLLFLYEAKLLNQILMESYNRKSLEALKKQIYQDCNSTEHGHFIQIMEEIHQILVNDLRLEEPFAPPEHFSNTF